MDLPILPSELSLLGGPKLGRPDLLYSPESRTWLVAAVLLKLVALRGPREAWPLDRSNHRWLFGFPPTRHLPTDGDAL